MECENIEIRDKRDGGWFWMDNEYLNGYAKFLTPSATTVYISLCRHSNNDTQQCFPSMRLIAEELGIATRTVVRATKELENWGIITIDRSKKVDGTQAQNIYILTAKKMWKDKPLQKCHSADRVTLTTSPSDINDINRVTPGAHNKTKINKTHINQSPQPKVGDEGVQKSPLVSNDQMHALIDGFRPVNPMSNDFYKRMVERNALINLVKQMGFETVLAHIQSLDFVCSQPFGPKITKPTQLQRDIGKLVLFKKQLDKGKLKETNSEVFKDLPKVKEFKL